MRNWPLLALLVSAALPASAADVYEIDTERSHAEFEVKVMWLVGVHGDFGTVSGTLTVDPFNSSARVVADLDTNTLHMRSRNNEAWAKSKEFFDSEHFPKIHFESDSFPIARLTHGGEVEGTLTLRGVTRPLHLDLDESECAEPLKELCAVEAFGLIRRSEFGMEAHRGTLSDKVSLRLSAFVKPKPVTTTP